MRWRSLLVAMARGTHLYPFRTEKLSPSAPMVLPLRGWESRSLPAFIQLRRKARRTFPTGFFRWAMTDGGRHAR